MGMCITTCTEAASCGSNYCDVTGGSCALCTTDLMCDPAMDNGFTCSADGECEIESDDDGPNVGLIVGLVVPFGLLLIAGVSYMVYKKKNAVDRNRESVQRLSE